VRDLANKESFCLVLNRIVSQPYFLNQDNRLFF